MRRQNDPARFRRAPGLPAPPILWDAILSRELASKDMEMQAVLPEVAGGRSGMAGERALGPRGVAHRFGVAARERLLGREGPCFETSCRAEGVRSGRGDGIELASGVAGRVYVPQHKCERPPLAWT